MPPEGLLASSLRCLSQRPPKRIRIATYETARHRNLTMKARTYDDALTCLDKLASNRTATSLFSQEPFDATTPSKPSRQSLNEASLPEMRTSLARAGYTPSDLTRIRHIHVAGTKGKGTVCAYATGLLRQYVDGPVGTYTSPHLVSPRERIAINGAPLSKELFTKAFFEVWDRFAETQGEARPFYFRFMTILAWHVYLTQGVKHVVMECGIGGEYDATNVLPPEALSVAVLTSLGIDHVAMLGSTVESIAWHKTGIFKRGVPALAMDYGDTEVQGVIRERAKEKGAHLTQLSPKTVRSWGKHRGKPDAYIEMQNQALAILAVREHLGMSGKHDPFTALTADAQTTTKGLAFAKPRGRSEVLDIGDTTWYLDGAHTADSLEAVTRWLEVETAGPLDLVFNQQERDVAVLLGGFLRAASERGIAFRNAVFTTNEHSRPREGEERDLGIQTRAAEVMRAEMPECQTRVVSSIEEAVEVARGWPLGRDGRRRVVVTGSFHLVGGMLKVVDPSVDV